MTGSRLLPIAGALVAFALGAVLPGAVARGGAEPTAVRSALERTTKVQGAPGRTMVLSKVIVEPGAKLALHHHLGTQISRVASGTLTYTVLGVGTAPGKAMPKRNRGSSAPSRRVRWRASTRVSGSSSSPPTFSKRRTAEHAVVIYISTLLKTGAPPATSVTLP